MYAIYIHFKIHRKSNKSTFMFLPSLENHGNKHWKIICILYLHRFAQAWPPYHEKKKRTVQVLFNISAQPASQLLSSAFLFSLSFMDIYAHGQFYTLTVYLRGYIQAYKVICIHWNLQLWAFGELNVSLCVFAKHYLNTWHCRCRKPHFLTTWLNLLVVKPSGKNTWYKPYDLCYIIIRLKKNTLQTN